MVGDVLLCVLALAVFTFLHFVSLVLLHLRMNDVEDWIKRQKIARDHKKFEILAEQLEQK